MGLYESAFSQSGTSQRARVQWPYAWEPLASADVPPSCPPPPCFPLPLPTVLGCQFSFMSRARAADFASHASSPALIHKKPEQSTCSPGPRGTRGAFCDRCLVDQGRRRQPAPQNARWEGHPPRLHALFSLRFLLSDLKPLSDAGHGPGLPQATSGLGCKPVAGPGMGKGQESHRKIRPQVTGGCETVWEGTGFLSTNLCESVLETSGLDSFPKESSCRAGRPLCVSVPLLPG